jgi:hypothetical protein
MSEAAAPDLPVFVVGSPRSGTTIFHAFDRDRLRPAERDQPA